jgi:predicted Zn finger-like uncharacterized protein
VQAQCPQCATRIQVEDAKVPDKPFKVRCPKCQHVMTLPGRGQEAAPAQPPSSPPAPPVPPRRRERSEAEGTADALVALSDPAVARALTDALGRLGYAVDAVQDVEEGTRLLEQAAYSVAVTSPGVAQPGRPETLAQRMLRLAPDTRRRVFVVLVGEEFRSADGTQAWVAQADLVLNPRDIAGFENLIHSALSDRRRLYQPFEDARRRIESA